MTQPTFARGLPVLAVALLVGQAQAQDIPAAEPMHLAQAEGQRQIVINDGADPFLFAASDLPGERVVKGAPYCAEAVHENVQWLPDGSGGASNRIVRQQLTRLCRDGEGRTRQEVERGKRKLVYLRDPVARENWVLDVERKTARRLDERRVSGGEGLLDPAAMREFAEKMKEFARSTAEHARGATSPVPPMPRTPPTPPTPPIPPMPVIIGWPDGGQGDAHARVIRMQGDADVAGGDWAMPPPAVQWRAQHAAPRGAGTSMPLPGKDIEGVRANGERTTWVIDAGKVGNEKPIQIVREVWSAPELMVTMSSRDFDPRNGEVNYRLRNLRRGEPDGALMRVPADFSKPARPAPAKASGPTG